MEVQCRDRFAVHGGRWSFGDWIDRSNVSVELSRGDVVAGDTCSRLHGDGIVFSKWTTVRVVDR